MALDELNDRTEHLLGVIPHRHVPAAGEGHGVHPGYLAPVTRRVPRGREDSVELRRGEPHWTGDPVQVF